VGELSRYLAALSLLGVGAVHAQQYYEAYFKQNISPAAYGGAGGTEIVVAETDLTRGLELIGRADGG